MSALAELAAWVVAAGGHHDGARVCTGGGRRWLAATRARAVDEELAAVPRAAIITREHMRHSSVGQQIRDAGLELSSPHAMAAAWLACEAIRPGSPWARYLATLPASVDDFPAIGVDDPHGLLTGTFAAAEIAAMALSLHGDYQHLRKLRLMAPVPPEDFAWARLCVGSRLFQLTIDGIATFALVPLCDLLDHAADAATRWGFEAERDAFVLRAARPLVADEELTTSYGAKANRQLLAQYGFALADNPHDEIDVAAHAVRADPERAGGLALGAALLAAAGGDRGLARARLDQALATVAARYRPVEVAAELTGASAMYAAVRRGEERVLAAWQTLAASGGELDAYFARAAEAAARKPAMVAA